MAQAAKDRQAAKRAAKEEPKAAPDVTRVNFNAVLRTQDGLPYRTARGAALRLGKAVIDALEQVSAREDGRPLEREEKLRRDKLAGGLVSDGLAVEDSAPYVVLTLPQRVVTMLDGVLGQAYAPGLYGAAHRLLLNTQRAADDYGYEGIEREAQPRRQDVEPDDGRVSDYTADPEDPDDEHPQGDAAGPEAGDLEQ